MTNGRVRMLTRDIKKGEKLTIDYNSVLWDRSDSKNADECKCGAGKCVGTMMGFKVCTWYIQAYYARIYSNRNSIQLYQFHFLSNIITNPLLRFICLFDLSSPSQITVSTKRSPA